MEQSSGHMPVLLNEVVQLLLPTGRKIIVDCTVGLGGHSEALLKQGEREATNQAEAMSQPNSPSALTPEKRPLLASSIYVRGVVGPLLFAKCLATPLRNN